MGKMTRRRFIKRCAAVGAGVAAASCLPAGLYRSLAFPDAVYTREAMHYHALDERTVKCDLCPHECVMKDGQRSFCRVREPRNGKLYTLVYELPCSVHIDPIEKKPIYHMLPGTTAFSIATAGCNLRCKFCQNWQISQSPPEDTVNRQLSCEDAVKLARQKGCSSIAYTYSEPIIFYEYMMDTAAIARDAGIKNIAVTAGFVNPIPLKVMCRYVDAANVDLKAYDDKYLQDVCAERLGPLLEALKIMRQEGMWVEITNLVVPTLNDDMAMIKEMCGWIRDNMGEDTPLHFSRFWPMFKLKNLPPTPVETLEEARGVAIKEGLNYVYIGNVSRHVANNTYCPNCKKKLIDRLGYMILENNIKDSRCKFCGHKIAGIWET